MQANGQAEALISVIWDKAVTTGYIDSQDMARQLSIQLARTTQQVNVRDLDLDTRFKLVEAIKVLRRILGEESDTTYNPIDWVEILTDDEAIAFQRMIADRTVRRATSWATFAQGTNLDEIFHMGNKVEEYAYDPRLYSSDPKEVAEFYDEFCGILIAKPMRGVPKETRDTIVAIMKGCGHALNIRDIISRDEWFERCHELVTATRVK